MNTPVTLTTPAGARRVFPSRAAMEKHFAGAPAAERRHWLPTGHRVRRATVAEAATLRGDSAAARVLAHRMRSAPRAGRVHAQAEATIDFGQLVAGMKELGLAR